MSKILSALAIVLMCSSLALAADPAPAPAANAPGVIFIDQMNDLTNWKCDDSTKLSIVKTERKTGESSMYIKYIIDKDNPGTVWFARTNVGIDRAPVAMQIFVNIPQNQRFTWYDFPKLRMILQDKDGTAQYADIDKFAARPVYEGGKSYYIPWAQVNLGKGLWFPLWPGANGKLDGIETISFELPHRTEDFMKDGEFTMYLDELTAVFDNADPYIKSLIDTLQKQNRAYEKKLASLPKGTWQRYPLAVMGVIDLFCTNSALELKEGKIVRAARQLEYLKQISDEVGANLALVKQGKNPYPNVEPAKYTGLKVKDGTYFDGDRPVFITGFCGGFGGDQLKVFKQMGFNGFSSGMWMGATRPDEKTTTQPTASINEAKFAADNNLAYDNLLSIHSPAGWMYEKWPDLDPSCRRRGSAPDAPLSPKNQYMPWNVDHAGFRQVVAEHLTAAVQALKDIPSMASYDICNEMWYLCHGDFDPNAFRARLEQRYKTIDALNKAWGTSFPDFKSVQYRADIQTSVADLYEYNQYRVTEFFRFCTDVIRKVDPRTPVCGKIHGCWRQMIGIDKAAMTQFFTATDSDVYPRIGNDEEPLVADMWTSSMITQEYRSLAPDKPQIDAEQHMIWYHQIVTYDFIRSLLWWRAVLGLDANYAWVWNRDFENFEENIFTQPWAFNAISQFAIDVERLAPVANQFQQVKPDVLLIEAGAKTPDAYRLASYSGYAVDLLPINSLNETNIKKYRTIIVPADPKLGDTVPDLLKVAKKSGSRIIYLTETSKLKNLTDNIKSKAINPFVQTQWGLVNYTAVDASGKPMVFLLNLNLDKVTVKVYAPRKTKAFNVLNNEELASDKIELAPLKPVIITLQ